MAMRLGAAALQSVSGRWVPLLVAVSMTAVLLAGPGAPRSTAAAMGATPPAGAEKISFQSRNVNQKEPVPAVMVKPPGDGPFPAVVLVHPCGGVTPTMYQDWTPWFVEHGYIVVVPDSLSPWHQTSICFAGGPRPKVIHPTVGDAAADAWGAL